MRVETVDILVEKAHFEPNVAVAVAQAMDVAMEEKMYDRQLVTVTVLREAKSELVLKIEQLGIELRSELEITATAIRAEMTELRAELKAEIASTAAALRAETRELGAETRELGAETRELGAETRELGAELKAEIKSSGEAIKAELRTEMHAMKSDLLRHMYTAMAAQLALLLGVSYFFVLHVK